jgi:glycerate 2-kinase
MQIKNFDELVSNGASDDLRKKRRDVLEILKAAVEAVDPYRIVAQVFQEKRLVHGSKTIDFSSCDHVYVVGFGKASVPMAQAVCDAVPVVCGVVITNDPSMTIPCQNIEVVVGGHPLPDEGSIKGTDKILTLLEGCGEHDCVIMVISGGGSSLLCKPLVSLDDLRVTTNLLQSSGADINELNTVRKHLSQVKGGWLVSHTKARVVSLVLSDVVSDSLSTIASGPTYPDSSTFSDARTVLMQHGLWERVPRRVQATIEKGIAGLIPETPKEGDPIFDTVRTLVVASNQLACDQGMKQARRLGYQAVLLSSTLTGEARLIGQDLILKVKQHLPEKTPTMFISGGETTVTVTGGGVGGRNQELVLGCVKELAGSELVVASIGTDGIDGNSAAAGAIADGMTFSRAQDHHLDPSIFLKNNDSHAFFSALHDAIVTGPTGTNVMDVQVILQ